MSKTGTSHCQRTQDVPEIGVLFNTPNLGVSRKKIRRKQKENPKKQLENRSLERIISIVIILCTSELIEIIMAQSRTHPNGEAAHRLLQKQTSSNLSGEGGDVVAAASHSPPTDESADEKPTKQHASQQHHSQHSIKGILLIMLGSFSFSVMFLLVKVMKNYNTFTLVFWRSLVQIAISLFDLAKKGTNPLGPDDGGVRFLLVCRAMFGAAAVCAWFFGIQILPLPDAVVSELATFIIGFEILYYSLP